VAVLGRRAVLDYLTEPRRVLIGLIEPILLMFLVASTFGKLGSHLPGYPAGTTYFQFIMPAVLVNNAIQAHLQMGAGLVNEMNNGFVARLRSLPILPSSILVAQSITGLVRTVVQAVILLSLAQLTHGNFSPRGLAGLVASVGLSLLLGWALGWIFLTVSTRIRRAETIMSMNSIVMLPLSFMSSAYVPINNLPTALAAIARVNPVTYAYNAERAIFLPGVAGSVDVGALLPPILASLVLGAVGASFAVRVFRRPLQLVQR
jgi:ABC-2 type transport system permease protein